MTGRLIGVLFLLLAVFAPWAALLVRGDYTPMVLQYPMFLFAMTGLLSVSVWIMAHDRWLGLLCLWYALHALVARSGIAIEVTEFVIFGAMGVIAVRTLDPKWRAITIRMLLLAGALQAVIAYYQALGFEFLMSKPYGVTAIIGNPGYVGTYLAPLVPLAPLWVAVVLLAGVVCAQSTLGMLSACAGLMVAHRTYWKEIGVAALFLSAGIIYLYKPDWANGSFRIRHEIWSLALTSTTWWQAIVGHGPGSWIQTIPNLQAEAKLWETQKFIWAHNDVLQLWYEGGVIALGCLGAWIWSHRQAFAGPLAGVLVALAGVSLGMFGWRLGTTAAVFVVLIGLATAEPQRSLSLSEGG